MSDKRRELFGNDPNALLQSLEKKGVGASKNDWLEKEFGIKTKVYEAMLPSEGLLYPEGHPLHGVESVEFIPMAAEQENIIRNRKLIENNTMGIELLRSCLVNKAIDPKTLFAGDSLSILYSIRAATYGSIYSPKIKCPSCRQMQKVSIDLSDIEQKELEKENIVPGVNEFTTVLPETGITIKFKLLNEEEAGKLMEEKQAREKKGLSNSSVSTDLASIIIAANGITDRTKIMMLAGHLPGKDSLHLRKETARVEPGLVNQFYFTCENFACKHEDKLQIPLGIEFWLPEAEV